MNNQDFSLYLRNGGYYVQFKGPVTGLPGIQRSTKKKNQKDAYRLVIEWMTNGFSKYEESATQVIQNDIAINSVVLCTLAELVENACLFLPVCLLVPFGGRLSQFLAGFHGHLPLSAHEQDTHRTRFDL